MAGTIDPMITAPGADDNASGTAAAIEVARVMKKNKYIPAFTTQFVAFAAEELMLSPGGCGSCYFASQAKAAGRKILMMLNNDMISYTASPGNWKVKIQPYDNSGWVSNLAFYIARNYTLLSAQEGYLNSWSDSHPFYDEGFCAVYFEESEFSPFYHRDSDSVANYNMAYCAEVAKISCGMMLYQSMHPNVKKLHAVQAGNTIRISWNKNRESNVAGYNVYRSTDRSPRRRRRCCSARPSSRCPTNCSRRRGWTGQDRGVSSRTSCCRYRRPTSPRCSSSCSSTAGTNTSGPCWWRPTRSSTPSSSASSR